MEAVVLVHHHERARRAPGERALPGLHLGDEALDDLAPHLVAVLQHVLDHGPVLVALGHLRVRVALVRVVDSGVDPALEDGQVRARADRLRLELAREQDVRERGQVSDVEERLVTEVDRLRVQQRGRDHAQRDVVPRLPAQLELEERGK